MEKYIKKCSWNCKATKNHKILEFKQCMKSDKMPSTIYADIKFLI